MNNKKTVFSGIRPTSRLHIGNYLGSVKGMIELQENPELETYYSVVDLHAITTPFDPKLFKTGVKDVVLDFLACGLNPEKSTIFIQSQNKEHAFMANLLSSVVSVARMQHLPTYKDKIKQNPNNVTMALLNYPVLMAADILIYKASFVPIGKDQEPHLEVTREIARKLNSEYGTDFPEPQTYSTNGSYVPSLSGIGKMSKSVAGSSIYLTDSLEVIRKKIAKIPTDMGKGTSVPLDGGVATLFQLFELFFSKEERFSLENSYLHEGLKYSDLKETLSSKIFNFLQPIQEKRQELEKKEGYLKEVILDGNLRANKKASQTVSELQEKFGMIYDNL